MLRHSAIRLATRSASLQAAVKTPLQAVSLVRGQVHIDAYQSMERFGMIDIQPTNPPTHQLTHTRFLPLVDLAHTSTSNRIKGTKHFTAIVLVILTRILSGWPSSQSPDQQSRLDHIPEHPKGLQILPPTPVHHFSPPDLAPRQLPLPRMHPSIHTPEAACVLTGATGYCRHISQSAPGGA